LRRDEDVEGELLRLFFIKHLERELPLRKGARFDRFPQITSMKFRVRAVNLDTLIPVERVRTSLGTQTKLDERRFPVGVYQAERMNAEALHHTITSRLRAIRHHAHQHVRRLRHQRSEIPKRI